MWTSNGNSDHVYVDENFEAAYEHAPRNLRSDLRALWDYLHAGPSAAHVALIVGALVYFISPIDAVPDLLPVVGYSDDLVVLAGAVAALGTALQRFRK